jgi:hypothetical protein
MTRDMHLSDAHEATLQRLIRQALRKAHRNIENLREKFGDEYDGGNMEGYLSKLEELYLMLGKDPRDVVPQGGNDEDDDEAS